VGFGLRFLRRERGRPCRSPQVECRGSRVDDSDSDPDPDPDLDETLKNMKLHENQEFPLAFPKNPSDAIPCFRG